VPISAIGSVSPVITVLRHEPRNRNTINTVSSAPSISVRFTSFTLSSMLIDESSVTLSCTPGGNCDCRRVTSSRTPCATSTVFSPCALMIDRNSARWPLSSATLSGSCWPSATSASWSSVTG
jgi:hypothetical protein